MRATGLPAPLRLRLEHAWVRVRFADCTEIVKGLGAKNVLGESFDRNVLGESFGQFFLCNHI